jgi:hypothetical protein
VSYFLCFSMLLHPGKVKMKLSETAQGIEKEDPKRDRLQDQLRRKGRKHFSLYNSDIFRKVASFKRTTVKEKENKLINIFK